jgi:hypothetical protein
MDNCEKFVAQSISTQLVIATKLSAELKSPIIVFTADPLWETYPDHHKDGFRYKIISGQPAVLSVAAQRTLSFDDYRRFAGDLVECVGRDLQCKSAL